MEKMNILGLYNNLILPISLLEYLLLFIHYVRKFCSVEKTCNVPYRNKNKNSTLHTYLVIFIQEVSEQGVFSMVAEWRTGKQAPEGSLKERLDMKCPPSFSCYSFWSSWL